MRKRWMMQISVLVLLAATVFSTGVTFADTGNTSSGTFHERVQDRLNTAVAEGKITAEEATEKLARLQERLSNMKEKMQSRLNAAVAEGKITEEEAAERTNRFEERGPRKFTFIGRDALQDRLNDAVAEGKITVEEAAEQLAKFEEIVDSGGKFRGPRFGHSGGNGQNNNANSAVYQGV
tara:strand:+ start:1090 stop:1626 length:537 start_codon:yes stop_codon:yes gene_type:complete